MGGNCQNCGVFISKKKPGTTIIQVSEDFRKKRPDVPAETYLCPREACAKHIDMIKGFDWYAGHEVVGK